ncbi:MAG: hypothetical protein IPN86_23320 [Saprospiraceae bacterium]|nr:hypothetical protein [Saprospiraceae bacterium]
MSIINKLNANLLIDFVQKSCTLGWLLPYAGGSYFFALPKKVTKNASSAKSLRVPEQAPQGGTPWYYYISQSNMFTSYF